MNENTIPDHSSGSAELPAVVGALLNTLDDKNEAVRKVVHESINQISKFKPSVVIHAAIYFWELHRKISQDHLTALLTIIAETCKNHAEELNNNLVSSVVSLAVNELTGYAEKQSYDILVGLSKAHCSLAMEALLIRFEPGTMLHHTAARAMGMIAAENPFGTIPFIKISMSVVLPMLPHMHDDELKISTCFMISKFAEAINDYLMNFEEASDPGFCKEAYIEDLPPIFDILCNSWLQNVRDIKLMDNILIAICAILPILPPSGQLQCSIKLLPLSLQYCKRPGLQLSSTRLLALILDCLPEKEKECVGISIEQIDYTLFQFVCTMPFEVTRDTLLIHYEVLKCYHSLVLLFPGEGLDRILQHLKSSLMMNRSKALVVLKHLINTLPNEDDSALQKIAFSLQDCLTDNNAKQVIGTIVALVARPGVPLLQSQRVSYVRYMVMHCGSSNEEAEAYQEALYLLASTVDGAESWLWPSLIKTLMDPTYIASVVAVLRALSPLATKIIRSDIASNEQKDFSGIKVLGRCLELMCDENIRLAVVLFLRNAASLFGHQLNQLWDEALKDLTYFLENDFSNNSLEIMERNLAWEEKVVDFLEQSVLLEGQSWGSKLADELMGRLMTPQLAIILSAICTNENHVIMLVELSITHVEKNSGEYARAVGICAKRHLKLVLKTMEDACHKEDEKKEPVKLLGLVRDAKGVAMAEAMKTGMLKTYAEIARRAEAKDIYSDVQRHIVRWIIKQLSDCKKASTAEAGLIALEQIGYAVHPSKLENSTGLKMRGKILATLLGLFQSPFGYKPIQLYPAIIKATIALIRIPPALTIEEKEVLLSTILDKTIAAENTSRLSETLKQVVEELGIVCTEIVGNSANMLAQLVDIIMPWMQSNSVMERKTALVILRCTLRTYHDSLKYTFPGGKLEPGKLLGRILSWSADSEYTLRPYVVDCVALSLSIGARHRTTVADTHLNQDLNEIKKIIINEDNKTLYDAVKILASTACEKIASGEVVSLAEGLIENLVNRNETAIAAGIALSALFSLRGPEIPRTNMSLIDAILIKIRHMDNVTCKHIATLAIKALIEHHMEEVVEQLLQQALPLDRAVEHCWREFGSSADLGSKILDILLTRLETNFELSKNASPTSRHSPKSHTASLSSLSAIIALGNLLQSATSEDIIEKKTAEILAVLLKYLSGWLYAEAPMSTLNTKFGFIPNRESCKINPCRCVYSVLVNVLTTLDTHEASALMNDIVFDNEQEGENKLINIVKSVFKCLTHQPSTICQIAKMLGKMMTSQLSAQRAVATAFYTEVIGSEDCDVIWLDAIMNVLHEAKVDSSSLVRKLATIGLTRIVRLDPKQIDEYFDSCLSALLDGLEETEDAGGKEVILESLRGLPVLLSVKTERPISPHIVLAIKPFLEKEEWEMRLAAINALRSVFHSYEQFSSLPDDDVADQFLSCLPCLTVKVEDSVEAISEAVRYLLNDSVPIAHCETLTQVIRKYLRPEVRLDFEKYIADLIKCLNEEMPQRAEELRNSIVMGYSRSEVPAVRATSALILGLFGEPRPEDIQRLLQLLRDNDTTVKKRAAYALALSFTV